MKKQREQAIELRYLGNSYSEIQKKLGIPKSTLSGWLSAIVISDEAQEKLLKRTQVRSLAGLLARNKRQTHLAEQRARAIRDEAAAQIRAPSLEEIKLIGAALYWAEGHKRALKRNAREVTYHPISLTNSDPALIKMFLRFLREYFEVSDDKIKAELRIFPHQNRNQLVDYWQKVTGIPLKNFTRVSTTISSASTGTRPFNRLPFGVLQIRVSDTALFHKLMGSIEGLQYFV